MKTVLYININVNFDCSDSWLQYHCAIYPSPHEWIIKVWLYPKIRLALSGVSTLYITKDYNLFKGTF